jgi:uncharacterized protein
VTPVRRLTPALRRKLERLKRTLVRLGRVLVAFSGGVDSTLLLKVAADVMGPNVLAVIAASETYPPREVKVAKSLARSLGVRCRLIHTLELKNPRFISNPPERCYYCKRELFSRLRAIARKENIPYVLDGANFDDRLDFRPGGRAGEERGVRSPLKDAKLTKNDIRVLSRHFGLPNWDKPSLACLASRFPYGIKIDRKSLGRVSRAEELIRQLGFGQLRVRHHGSLARIEVMPRDFPRLFKGGNRVRIVRGFKKLGYLYVTFDLEGYRTGSLNAALKLPAGQPSGPR